jgi:hypothetical protein
MVKINTYYLTPAGLLERYLQAQIERANGERFTYTFPKSALEVLLPPDAPDTALQVAECFEKPTYELKRPETSMDKLRKVAERLGMTVETDSQNCRVHDVIILEKAKTK